MYFEQSLSVIYSIENLFIENLREMHDNVYNKYFIPDYIK